MHTPNPHRSLWPWQVQLPASDRSPDPSWPRISIVTPSYNQEVYLEETLLTVLGQGYPNLQYIVMEDASTDGSPAILERYRSHLSQIVAQPNRGFGAVLHDGLSRTDGEIMAWLNSDDLYLPGTLRTVAEIFRDCPEVDWLAGSSLRCDSDSRMVERTEVEGFGKGLFFAGRYLGGHPNWGGGWIPQESVFWRRRLWNKAGGYFLQERLQYGDFELWTRFWKHADLHALPMPLGVYRIHPQTYTAQRGTKSIAPCTAILDSAGIPRPSGTAIRLRALAARLGARFRQALGEPSRFIVWDQAQKRWRTEIRPAL